MNQKQIRIYRYRRPGAVHGNFGDEITIDILETLFRRRAVAVNMRQAELIGAGSILDIYPRRNARERLRELVARGRDSCDLHVWGTGAMLPDAAVIWPQTIHVHAVRGPLTAERLGLDTPAIGDPGILANRLVDTTVAKTAPVALIPHFTDFAHVARLQLPRNWMIVNPEHPVRDVLRQISAAELVVSSSLHGLIAADSFGIPCVWASPKTPYFGNTTFKFSDYAASRLRPFNEPLPYAAVLSMSPEEISIHSTCAARDVTLWQEELIRSFPF